MFLFRGQEAHSRSLAKALNWRILGSIDTFLLSWLFTRSAKAVGAIAITEVLTKMVLYFVHERAWSSIRWGKRADHLQASPVASREPAQ